MVKILIVDDDEEVRESLKEMAENRGYEVETAIDEDDAEAKIEEKEYDVVIADMRMKREDSGVIVVRKVKEKYPLTQVIVLTAYGSIENAGECMEEGAFSYVDKNPSSGDPYRILFLKIKRALELREAMFVKESFLQGFRNALTKAIELCDRYVKGHSDNVARVAKEIAKEMKGLSEKEWEEVWLAGIIHDIGKIGIYSQVLSKPTKLNHGEFGMIKAHPEIGERVVSEIPELKRLAEIVVQHHERYDGDTNRDEQPAYPGRVKRKKINILASIISVADAYDAIISDRVYHKGKTKLEAKEIIEKERGKQFNPKVVDAFLRAFDNGKI